MNGETTEGMATTDTMGEETTDGPATTTEGMETTDDAGETTAEPTTEPTESEPQESVTVTVGADGAARYSPDSFTLAQGGEVTWEYAMGGHNVIPESMPDGASFEGSPNGESETQDSGFSFSETFDTAGEYAYYCSVHRSIGMEGSFTVE
ncbi:halocyanin [Halomarina oriensis]|uniref:Halocyanin n=2 Tax=Halomarina oriensis TaxID=671145 RepID=A0A6B0GFV2_9EURY|nr:halocyanin [Halomarina oriensis]